MKSDHLLFAAFTVLLAGVGIAAYLLGVPILWIVVGLVVMLALTYVLSTRRAEGPPES